MQKAPLTIQSFINRQGLLLGTQEALLLLLTPLLLANFAQMAILARTPLQATLSRIQESAWLALPHCVELCSNTPLSADCPWWSFNHTVRVVATNGRRYICPRFHAIFGWKSLPPPVAFRVSARGGQTVVCGASGPPDSNAQWYI